MSKIIILKKIQINISYLHIGIIVEIPRES